MQKHLQHFLKTLGSLRLAVVLIAVYAIVLAWGTLVEKWHGAEAAHAEIYDAGWFTALGFLLGVNILCAMLIRLPWRWRQFGFLTTHGGILVLLIGCWISQQFGIEAQLPVFEGQKTYRAYLDAKGSPSPSEMDLGFQVELVQFQRRLDPGSGMASHYSSLVNFLDRNDPPRTIREKVLITLNAPVDFTDPESGRTYRLFQSSFGGPWRPGQPEFDQLVQGDPTRDCIYLSRLSLNSDPGRSVKYAGCLMITLGIAAVYYSRPRKQAAESDNTIAAAPMVVALLLIATAAGVSQAEETAALDWTAWREMPVLGEGRVMPLDTFARETVETICGRMHPTLAMPGETPRAYDPAELLFAWLAEPERWENAAFLTAADRELRTDVLGLPLTDENGRRLRYASPQEVENNANLGNRYAAMEKREETEGSGFHLSALEKKIKALVDAYGTFRLLTYDPKTSRETPRRFFARARSSADAWRTLAGHLQHSDQLREDATIRDAMVEAGKALQTLIERLHDEEFSPQSVLQPVAMLREVGARLATRLADCPDRAMAALAADLNRQTAEMQLAIDDNGETLRLVPALNPGAYEANREPGDDAVAWLAFRALIDGSDDLMRPYPQEELQNVRKAWAEVKSCYLDRGAADRSAKFSEAMNRFVAAVRQLAERIEPLRRKLLLQHTDQEVLDATAYPVAGSTSLEVWYNRLDPFFWAWVVSLAATIILLLSVGRLGHVMFRLGIVVLLFAVGFTAAGMTMRGCIMGLVPLTGMYETVLFVALYSALLGLWYAMKPQRVLQELSKIQCSPHPFPLSRPTFGRCPERGNWSHQRRLFAIAGAMVSFIAMVLAYYAPATVMHRHIGTVAPILRDNFWLAVHVVTIMASYASAAIALILGNVALGYYLLGRYTSDDSGQIRHPPQICSDLSASIYTVLKITVLLLVVGTILGALWADQAWGRFWAWDPKEVWALISLLVYSLILHARHVGWAGEFGMAVASVLGGTAILFTWYGVNFILGSGMHSYGAGAGGGWAVGMAVAVQWGFLAAAAGRKGREERGERRGGREDT